MKTRKNVYIMLDLNQTFRMVAMVQFNRGDVTFMGRYAHPQQQMAVVLSLKRREQIIIID